MGIFSFAFSTMLDLFTGITFCLRQKFALTVSMRSVFVLGIDTRRLTILVLNRYVKHIKWLMTQ